jgi:acyl-CoA synthetase (NDP forming)
VYRSALDILIVDPDVDALLVIFVPPWVTRADDVAAALADAATRADDTTIVACFLGRTGVLPRADAGERTVPTYGFPESAAGALGRIARHAAWLTRPVGVVPDPDDIDVVRARAAVEDFLRENPDGGWAPYATVEAIMDAYGVPTTPSRTVVSADQAAEAAAALGCPVALKAGSPSLVHKTDVGGVTLGLPTPDAAREAFLEMQARLGPEMGGAVVQAMVDDGIEMIVGATRDPLFGPLVLVGLGGVQAELLRDTTLRFAPLTDQDAHDAVRSLRGSPLLFGYRSHPAVDAAALEDVLTRVGLLAADVAEVVELDANPVMVSEAGAVIVDLRARIAPTPAGPPADLRRL